MKLFFHNKRPKKDPELFERFYKEFFPVLCSYAKKFLSGDPACRDIVQEGFIYLWENNKFSGSREEAKAYLYQFVKNRMINYLRDKKNRERIAMNQDIPSMVDFDEAMIQTEAFHLLHQAIRDLSTQSQKVLHFRLAGYTNHEIAEQLNVSVNTVKTIKRRAYKMLRDRLD